ncbi:MAG TPA: hypothetical protein PKA28_10890 [Methylomusa anaerophila]|uniref:Uncharacterized protein n=1 Tax=Methylomusa anaerophila TaxID=1930071 RepID=A0A348AJ18_9FIRM|nr:hypothetical protein [Methylomusa anaerophila]BBB91066.1 hypothetical protein MAMMFC1_01734 [Methylomusa anaerophila]HML88941.1 hypothetical protein [Methylomusa anaerophila]
MAQYNGMSLTAVGLQLETKAQTGVPIHFTRVALGDGQLQSGQLLSALTNLISPKLNLPIIVNDVTGTGTARMQVVLKNEGLATGFFAREIGVYATDPDAGEILYAVANAGNNADYIPAGGGADLVELIFEVYTVVGQAANVTADINTSLLYATVTQMMNHENSTNPHPEFLKLGATVTDCSSVIVQQSDPKTIYPMPFDTLKQKVLGGDGSDMQILAGRVDQIEREQANQALATEAQQIFPDYNAMIVEDFANPDKVDTFECEVTSIAAGDDSIDVTVLAGIVPGASYTITDGVYQEVMQIKSIVKNGSTLRVIMTEPVNNTYLTGSTHMYRTTAQIVSDASQAEGAGDQKSIIWQPTVVWQGLAANNTTTLSLNTTQSNSAAFIISGDIGFTAGESVTLI